MSSHQYTDLVKQGYICLRNNNFKQAFEYFNQAVNVNPENFDAWFALGSLFSQSNNLDQAVNTLKKAVDISPENPMAHGQLGVAYYRVQCLDEAIECYKKVIELEHGNIAAYANLAIAYLDAGNREDAVACCTKAIDLKPDFTAAYILLASAYAALGRFEDALGSYDEALRQEPENLTALSGKADSLIKLGHKKMAYEVLKHKIDNANVDPSIATAYATVSSVTGREEDAANYLEKALRIKTNTHMQQLQLYFSAGNLYDSMGQYDKAFKYYVRGNELVKRNYDADADRKLFDQIIDTFTSENIRKIPHARDTEIKPVFIIGMPRSGTSLVERILGSHMSIYPAGELADIPELADSLSGISKTDKEYPECLFDIDNESINEISQRHIQHLAELSDGQELVTDKLPHNFLFLGLISILFPGARVIHCTRDPLDTCLSNYFQYFSGNLNYPYQLKNIASHYNNYLRIMSHWKKTVSLPMIEVSYENLVNNQERETRRMISFLDLPWDENCLSFNESTQITRTASYDQVSQPVYSRSVSRWKKYEKHIGELIENLHPNYESQ